MSLISSDSFRTSSTGSSAKAPESHPVKRQRTGREVDHSNSCARTRPWVLLQRQSPFQFVTQFIKDNFTWRPITRSYVSNPPPYNLSSVIDATNIKIGDVVVNNIVNMLLYQEQRLPYSPKMAYELLLFGVENNLPKANTLLRLNQQRGFGVSRTDKLRFRILPTESFLIHHCSFLPAHTPTKPRNFSKNIEALANVVKIDESIRCLWVETKYLNPLEVFPLSQALMENTTIEELKLSLNSDKPLQSSGLHHLLVANSTLSSLNLQCKASENDKGITLILEALQSNSSITTLNLSNKGVKRQPTFNENNPYQVEMQNVFLSTLQETFKTTGSLRTLKLKHLGDNKLGITLGHSLLENSSLTTLSVSHVSFCKSGVDSIASGLIATSTLTSLRLKNAFHLEDCNETLIQAMRLNSTITRLKLDSNIFTFECNFSFIEAVFSNPTITILSLSNCMLTNADGIAIGNFLRTNSTLISLNLHSNTFDKRALISIAESLRHNYSLNYLNLQNQMDLTIAGRHNTITPSLKTLEAFHQLIRHNPTLTTLKLLKTSNHAIDDAIKENRLNQQRKIESLYYILFSKVILLND